MSARDRWLWVILAMGLGVRLFGLDEPLIDWQAWRQADTAAIARNFVEEEGNLFYPRVDWRGTTPGYVETNFPLYPFLVSLLYRTLGGAEEWAGRLLAALFSTATAFLLYQLSWRLYRDLWAARLGALLFLIFPLNIFFGRAFMPEATMLLLSVAALLAFQRWLEDGRATSLVLASVTAALCFLVKIPTLYLGFPLVALAWSRFGWNFLRRPLLWVYLAGVLLPPALWHLHAYGLFEQTGLTFGVFGASGYDKWVNDLVLDPHFYLLLFGERLGHKVFTPPGLLLVLLGLSWWRAGERLEWMTCAWLGGLMFYLLLIPEGNRKLHYYQLPFVPLGALLAGKALGLLLLPSVDVNGPAWLRWALRRTITQRRALVLFALLATTAYSYWVVQPYYRPPKGVYRYFESCLAAGTVLDRVLPPNALLVIGEIDENAGARNRAQSPTMLYYAHRKGWQITPDEFSMDRLDSLAALGADYFVSPGGFVLQNQPLWEELLSRGVTFPAGYPTFWTDAGELDRARRTRPGPDSHFLVARLGPTTE